MTDHENYCPKCGEHGKQVRVIKERFGFPCCNTYDEPGPLRYCLMWNAKEQSYEAMLLTPEKVGTFSRIFLSADYITACSYTEIIIKDLGLFPVHTKEYDILRPERNKRTNR